MYVFISILILICSVLLVLIVLIQNSKGGGLAAGFSSSNQVLGVRKTTDFLEKATWALAGFLVFFCVAITSTIPERKAVSNDSEVIENVSTPVNTSAPDFGIAQPEAAPSGTVTPSQTLPEQDVTVPEEE
ncbi:MAG: preprotein translocase subunit SecG [Tannerella sp.]|jgi:preprotein translocase subunit SecG|nr:preprotein translocase subunit SecG [Tannerella sp.]